MGKAVEDGAVPLAVAAEEGHGIGAVLLLDLIELPGDGLIGLVPADGLEPALAPLAYPAQRGFDAILPVDKVPQGGALCAQVAVVVGVLRGALHPDDFPVLHIAVHAAVVAGAADGAQGVLDLDSGIGTGDLGFDFLFKLSQRISLLKSR